MAESYLTVPPLSDESKLLLRFIFASSLLYVQFILMMKVSSIFTKSKHYEPQRGTHEEGGDQRCEVTAHSKPMFEAHMRRRSLFLGLDENKYAGKFFILKKTQAYLKKTRRGSFGYQDSQLSQIWWWYQRRVFQIKRMLAWKNIPFLMTYSIPERLEILGFQIGRFLRNRAKSVALVSALLIVGFWRYGITHFVTGFGNKNPTSFIDLFTLDELNDNIQPGYLLEVTSIKGVQSLPGIHAALKNAKINVIEIKIVKGR